jgi:flagellar biosynthesis/type III secretory pathway protein FliH
MINAQVIHTDEQKILPVNLEVLETTQSLADVRDRARHEGFESGYAEGLKEAARENAEKQRIFDEKCQTVLIILNKATEQAKQFIAVKQQELESYAAELAIDIAEAVISQEVSSGKITILDTIKHALAMLPSTGEMTGRVNPEDLEFIESNNLAANIHLIADPSITKASCVLEIGSSMVDARLDEAIARVKRELKNQTSKL